jgi:hypothetical protein
MILESVRRVVAAGTSSVLFPTAAPWTLSVVPESGGTATVDVTATPRELWKLNESLAVWHALDDEPIDAATLYAFPGPVVAIRVTATTENAVMEIAA